MADKQAWDPWPAGGDVNERGFCLVCRSFWCPHAAPQIYQERKRSTRRRDFEDASNTIVLDKSHERGISRGLSGQVFAAEQLGVDIVTSSRSPYDLLAADGTRVDVKTSRHGMPLMVPKTHAYKLDSSRVDALLLVWDGAAHELVGQVSVADFLERCRDDLPLPIPTFAVVASELDPIPDSWRGAG